MRSVNASFILLVALLGCCWFRIGPAPPPPPQRNEVVIIRENPQPQPQPQPKFVPPVQAPARRIPGEKFAYIQQCLQQGQAREVDIRGRNTNNAYRDLPADGAVLVGLNVGLKKFFDKDVIASFRPIYLTRNGEKTGSWVGPLPTSALTLKAKSGYAVGSISIRTGLSIDGFALNFVKLEEDRLNTDDNYASAWAGNTTGGGASTIGSPGVLAVGICGFRDDQGNPCSLGLIAAPLQ